MKTHRQRFGEELSGRHDYNARLFFPLASRGPDLSNFPAMTSPVVQPSRPYSSRQDDGVRSPLDRYAFWFFAVALFLGVVEMGWRILGL